MGLVVTVFTPRQWVVIRVSRGTPQRGPEITTGYPQEGIRSTTRLRQPPEGRHHRRLGGHATPVAHPTHHRGVPEDPHHPQPTNASVSPIPPPAVPPRILQIMCKPVSIKHKATAGNNVGNAELLIQLSRATVIKPTSGTNTLLMVLPDACRYYQNL